MKIKFKGIKKSFKISGIIAGAIIIFLFAIFFLLQTSKIQQIITQAVVKDFSERIGSNVKIAKAEYKFFNTISLQDVYVEDMRQDTLLHIQRLDTYFDLFRFFKGKIIFHSIDFDKIYANFVVNEDGKNNFDFLIEAFSNRDAEKSGTKLEYKISNFRLKNSSIQFRNLRNQSKNTQNKTSEGQINFNCLRFDEINAEIAIHVLSNDTLSAQIINFSGEEKSGLKLVNLKTSVTGSPTQLNVPDFNIILPNSHLLISDVALRYDSIGDFRKFSEKIRLKGKLHSSYLKLDDIGSIIPQLKNMEAVATLETSIDGQFSNLHVRGIKIRYGDSFILNGDLDLNGLPDLQQTFVYGNLKELQMNADDTEKFISDLMQENYKLPEEMRRLGTMQYQGNITGFFSNLVIYGNLKTSIGDISTDVLLQLENDFRDINYNGTIQSTALNLGKLMMSENVGNIAFYFNTTGSKKMNSSFHGIIDANVYKLSLYNYEYQDIYFNGEYDGNGFNGRLKVEDENVNISFNGLIDMTQKLPVFDFELIVKETNLCALNLITKYPETSLSFNGKTNMTGNSLDNINGFFRLDSISFRNGDKTLDVDEIIFSSRTDKDYTNFSIESKYLNGSFSGNFKYSKLTETLTQILQKYLPSLENKKIENEIFSRIDVDLTISNTEEIARLFEIPHKLDETAKIKGYLDESDHIIDIVATIPRLISKEQRFNNTTLHLWGENEKLEFIVESNIPTENDYWNMSLYTVAQADSLIVNFEWRNRQQIVNRGKFKTQTRFLRDDKNKTIAQTSISPSKIVISDSLWNVEASGIEFKKDIIRISDFRFGNDHQYLNIDGIVSKSKNDSLTIAMKDVDLGFISTLANMSGFHIGGITTGNAVILSALERAIFDVSLSVKDLKLNHKWVGDASVFSTWDQVNDRVVAIASINNESKIIALGECTYSPTENMLDILIDANRVNLDFLSRYYEKTLSNTTGYASGKLRIGGPLGAIRFDGKLKVNEGQTTVDILGSTFYFNDTIVMTPNSITFPNSTLYDVENNKVTLDGSLTHNGNFRDFRYNLNIETSNAQVANLKPGDNELFFGKAYADASVRITGDENDVDIRVNARTRPGTKIFIQTGSSTQATDAGFIQFVQHRGSDEDSPYATPRVISQSAATNVTLNLQIEATPVAEIGLIVDPVSGDIIAGKGNGNIRIEYDSSQDDTKMYGTYTIESGNYLFTFQDVFRKEFRIESGSSVYWTGSPSNAQVNIRAIYSLTASLKDLLDSDMLNSVLDQNTRMTVPVNCILILTDNLMSPAIQFEINLPSSDEGVKQVVRNVINTEEMLTTQILYLLVFNKFYMANNQNIVNFGSNEFISLAASTVSSQLNNLISQFSTNNSFSLGFDMRRVNEVDMEYQFDLLYQPNDRWIVNGNFGYRENNNEIENYNQYITDVDIEYLLTEAGKLRFKVYNHTIDRTAQLRTAKNTQGVGFVYRESFDSVADMFGYYWRFLTGKKKKNKENEENSANN